jgi:hypothetical protein
MLADFENMPFSSRQKSIGRDRRDLLIGCRTHSHVPNRGEGTFSSSLGERKLMNHFVVKASTDWIYGFIACGSFTHFARRVSWRENSRLDWTPHSCTLK